MRIKILLFWRHPQNGGFLGDEVLLSCLTCDAPGCFPSEAPMGWEAKRLQPQLAGGRGFQDQKVIFSCVVKGRPRFPALASLGDLGGQNQGRVLH